MRFRRWLRLGRPAAPRVVVDTNVLVSGSLVAAGAPARILTAARDGEITLIASPLLLDEYVEVMGRRHITKKYWEAPRVGQATLQFLLTKALIVPAIPQQCVVPDDPDDDAVVACAIEARAAYIVTGDAHLLGLGTHSGIRTLTPREFVTQVLH